MATVNMKDVSKFYNGQRILNTVNLNIEQGEFVAVVGPSGCGKSTLLRLVAGLDKVCEGRILINNQCVNNIPPAARDMAMVFQNYALYPHMSVYDNMAYGLKMRGFKKSDIHQRVNDVSKLLQLSDYLDRKPSMLSGGQRQRVAMGRAIIRSPAVFLFDEPLSNLDAKLRMEMRHEIKKLHQQLKTTCLYVTHDQTEAMTMADKIVILNKGMIEQIGTPRELYENPASIFVASFIGHFPMNFLPATVDFTQKLIVTTTGITFPMPDLSLPISCGDEVVIGIRPEHMYIISSNTEHQYFVANIEFVDDLGADKLVQMVTCQGDIRFSMRTAGDNVLPACKLAIGIDINKANLFCKKTEKRLGGWCG